MAITSLVAVISNLSERVTPVAGPQAYAYLPQSPIVHVDYPRPEYPIGIYLQFISSVKVIVEYRRAEVVGRCYCMEVPCEVQIDLFHGQDLRVPPPVTPPLMPKLDLVMAP